MKTCNICGFMNQDDACMCSVCKSEFDPSTIKKEAVPKSNRITFKEAAAASLVILIITFLLMIPIVMWLDLTLMIDEPFPIILMISIVIFATLYLIYVYAIRSNSTKETPTTYTEYTPGYAETYMSNPTPHTTQPVTETREPRVERTPEPEPEKPKPMSYSSFNQALNHFASQFPHPEIAFNEEISIAEAIDQMSKKTGVTLEQARRTLAAIASRRLVVFCSEDEAPMLPAVYSVSSIAGTGPVNVILDETCSDPRSLTVTVDPNYGIIPSYFLSAICGYGGNSEIKHLDVSAVAPDKLADAFVDMTPFLNNPFIDGEIEIKDVSGRYANVTENTVVSLPANCRIIVRTYSDRKIPIAAELLHCAAWVEVSAAEQIAAEEEYSAAPCAMSFERLARLTDENEGNYYISEEHWKRIDELCDYLAQTVGFHMDNRLATAIERFSGVYMAGGGSEEEAIDAALACLILPEALSLLSNCENRDHGPLLQFLDERIGLVNLPLCADYLKKYGTI